jgi:O-antigen/teichoic acid export membrane protein
VSPLDPEIPPAGEELHLPGPSVQPVLLAAAIAVAIVGVTTSIFLVIAGGLVTIGVIIAWIRGARRELQSLPLRDERH